MAKDDQNLAIDYDSRSNFAVNLVANLTQKTEKESPYDPDSYEKPYNPDTVYKASGDYKIYESMLEDDQVAAAMQLKKDLVLGSGFDITGSEDVKDEIIDDIFQALQDDQEIPFEDQLEELLTSYEFGFSLSERIFKKRDDGTLTLKCLKTRHPNTWRIHQDKYGAVSKYVQITTGGDREIPDKNLIHYINNRRFQNPFGRSDLKAAHTAWRIKVEVLKYYAIFLEKHAGGTAISKYPRNMPKGPRADLYSAIKKLQSSTAINVPEGVEIEILEAKTDGQAFQMAINLFNTLIGRAVMIPDLLGFSGSETSGGSFSLGKNQMDIFFKHIRRRRRTLEKLVNHFLIKPIVVYNHGMLDEFPKFEFKPIEDEDGHELAKIWLEAIKGKLYKPTDEEINYFREQVKFPRGEIERVEQPQPSFGNIVSDADADSNNDKSEQPQRDKETERAADSDDGVKEEKKEFTYDSPEKTFSHRVDFKAVEKQLDGSEVTLLNTVKPIMDDMMNRLSSSINKKKIVQNSNLDGLDQLKLDRKADLRRAFESHFKKLYIDAKAQASRELFKENFAKINIEQQFLDFLNKEIIWYIGDLEESAIKDVRVRALEAIRSGQPFSVVEAFVRNELSRKKQISLERFARTRTTEVFNRGRVDFFSESEFVVGFEYSAVMDGRTTPICAGLHGKMFRKGTEPIPPMHFNCRSLLLPITRFDDWKPSTGVKVGTIKTKRDGNISIPSKIKKDGKTVSTGKEWPMDKFVDNFSGDGFGER